ncbi:MAG: Gfo/Idh/MocA family oxidoreductase [Cytophagales bacterium]|nr:Gfo/Idh/MocA family oxidoreductase [Cytophagales bacterium]
MDHPIDRRSFVKNSSLAVAGSVIAGPSILEAKKRKADPVRIGFIGTGGRGRTHVNNILDLEGVVCPAICDIDPKAVELTREIFKNKSLSQPKVYASDEYSFRDMLEKEKLDGVVISTNWTWHTPMCLDAMKAGVYVGVEVSGAFSVDECWDLVNTHQQTGTHLMILENVCYRRDVMAVLNMARDNLFGELIHARGGYLHDLRKVKFNDGKGGLAFGEHAAGEARWRTEHSVHRNGDLYPTHGLGPVGVMMDQNRGNRLTTISSVATKSRSLKNYIRKHPKGGEKHEYDKINWRLGDVVTSTITTARGETIILTHDTNLPRPYSLGFRVQGIEGLIDFDYGTRRIYIEDQSQPHRWDDAEGWLKKYDHELWRKYESKALGSGHGGMDFFLDRAFVESVRRKEAPVLDVYDAATWRSITPLSERSIQQQGMPQHIPDFTGGRWIKRKPVFGLGDI